MSKKLSIIGWNLIIISVQRHAINTRYYPYHLKTFKQYNVIIIRLPHSLNIMVYCPLSILDSYIYVTRFEKPTIYTQDTYKIITGISLSFIHNLRSIMLKICLKYLQLPELMQKYKWLCCDSEPQGCKVRDSNYFTCVYT